ncbi:hypothetical protein BDV93DRAFT_554351 [Ceratobasidium sp. AG-I]|nr:hypothetical protein BDV93DRAFT_554351 [Ceratobasidium sp. AG-I]
MDNYSSLFTSGLMLLCDSANPRSRQPSPGPTTSSDSSRRSSIPVGLRSFLSLEMAESLRTFATGNSPSPSSSRAHSRKPSSDRRVRPTPSAAASSSSLVPSVETRVRTVSSPSGSRRRRSLPQPKPAPLAQLPVLPGAPSHVRACSDSAASPVAPKFSVSAPTGSANACAEATTSRRHLAPISSSLTLELSSAPTTPCSQFPTTPTSTRAFSMFSPLSPPSGDNMPWGSGFDPVSPSETWTDAFVSALSPISTDSALGLRFMHPTSALSIVHEGENVAPRFDERAMVPKRARARRDRHSAPSRNTSVTANSTRSSQGSVTTSYRRTQRSGALARLEGKTPRSEWMSDDEEGVPTKFKPTLGVPSSNVKGHWQPSAISTSVRNQLSPLRPEDQSFSFIDLSDDVASIAARRGIRSFAV